MPWLSIIMALLTFFLAGGSKPENRGKAAALGLAAGAATYGITHYTDWGRESLGQWDGLEVTVGRDGNAVSATKPDGTVVKPAVTTPTQTGNSGFWSGMGNFLSSGAGQIAAVTAGAAVAGVPRWAIIGGIALLAFAILK